MGFCLSYSKVGELKTWFRDMAFPSSQHSTFLKNQCGGYYLGLATSHEIGLGGVLSELFYSRGALDMVPGYGFPVLPTQHISKESVWGLLSWVGHIP